MTRMEPRATTLSGRNEQPETWTSQQRPTPRDAAVAREDIMHPMFVTLFMETDADDLLPEQDRRRRARRSQKPLLLSIAASRAPVGDVSRLHRE
jgi:hypothetical protein